MYANALSDEDVRAARPREMKQAAEELVTAFAAASSWVRPEILTLDPAKVRKWIAQEPKLAPYRVFLEETLRRKPHTLGAAEEKIVAEAGEMERAGRRGARRALQRRPAVPDHQAVDGRVGAPGRRPRSRCTGRRACAPIATRCSRRSSAR